MGDAANPSDTVLPTNAAAAIVAAGDRQRLGIHTRSNE
jgi:hypothetical protein